MIGLGLVGGWWVVVVCGVAVVVGCYLGVGGWGVVVYC
jgi:hypothetical protein